METYDPDEYLPVESAGTVAGISPRTLRYWITGGKLPAIEGQRGRLVRLGDVLGLAEMTGKATATRRQSSGNVAAAGNPARSAGSVAGNVVADDATTSTAISPAARSQLEAIRDEWLRPLVDRIGELEREAGQLQAERDNFAAQLAEDRGLADQLVDLLQAERDALAARLQSIEAQARTAVAEEPRRPAWRRWLGGGKQE